EPTAGSSGVARDREQASQSHTNSSCFYPVILREANRFACETIRGLQLKNLAFGTTLSCTFGGQTKKAGHSGRPFLKSLPTSWARLSPSLLWPGRTLPWSWQES